MKMHFKYIHFSYLEFKRALHNLFFWMCIPVIVIVRFFVVKDEFNINFNNSVTYLLILSAGNYGIGNVMILLLCSLPTAAGFLDDLENRYIYYIVSRYDLKHYVRSKISTIFLSSLILNTAGIIIFVLLLKYFYHINWIDEQTEQLIMGCGGFKILIKNRYYFLWCLCYALQYSLGNSILIIIASCSSLFIHNRFLIWIIPNIINQVLLECSKRESNTFWISKTLRAYDAVLIQWKNTFLSIGWCIILCILFFTLVNLISYFTLKTKL